MSANQAKILMVYIEPTTYIVDLIKILEKNFPGKMDVLFLKENFSQTWNIPLESHWLVLAKQKKNHLLFLAKLIYQNKYQAIHLAGWAHPLILCCMAIAKLKGLSIVIESDTPHPPYIIWWKKIIKSYLYPMLFRQVNLFLPGGTRQADYLADYGVNRERLIIAQMTVDVMKMQKFAKTLTVDDKQLARQKYGFSHDEVIFGFVGRLVEYKGVLDLIAAFYKIQSNKAKLLIIGDGILQDKILQETQANPRIRYAGRLSDNELIKLYHAMDVLVLPSHFEPWGLTINEAMAMGRPVIVADNVGCIDDLVVHHQTGLIIKTKNVEELVTAIDYMATAAEARLAMGEQSARKMSQWTLEHEAERISQAWDKLLCI